jgi:cytoplasmic iron level regulating protein YaaA (DUF328/UPF0246 family)
MRSEVAAALRRARGGDQKLLGVGGDALSRARAANQSVIGAPTLPAWQRYTGVVWDHLDLASMTAAARKAAAGSILVPSGLLGVVRADEQVPDYKLKMGASIAPLGKLGRFWSAAVTAEIARLARGRVIVDLLPQEHAAAVDWDALPGVIHVDLVARAGGAVGGHNAKAAKGLLARHLIERADGPTVGRAAAEFRHGDYKGQVRA